MAGASPSPSAPSARGEGRGEGRPHVPVLVAAPYLNPRPVKDGGRGQGEREGRIIIDAPFVNNPNGKWFKPGFGKTEWFKDCDVGPEMVVAPAGEFTMGSHDYDSEKPPHMVTIGASFAVSRYAIPFAEWDACVAASGCKTNPKTDWGRGRQPVMRVSCVSSERILSWRMRPGTNLALGEHISSASGPRVTSRPARGLPSGRPEA